MQSLEDMRSGSWCLSRQESAPTMLTPGFVVATQEIMPSTKSGTLARMPTRQPGSSSARRSLTSYAGHRQDRNDWYPVADKQGLDLAEVEDQPHHVTRLVQAGQPAIEVFDDVFQHDRHDLNPHAAERLAEPLGELVDAATALNTSITSR